ncbi:integrase [Candidatus Spongiihabitans sp.]|uniref:integrase n=1 Tax=Candidatus Spongiihabitans sp. TaxID=3101308 RepID=UPI003C7CE3B6
MSAIIKEVYDAFLDAGASEQKAADAAKAIANYDERFNKIESDLLILKWMVGLVIVVNVLPILRSVFFS